MKTRILFILIAFFSFGCSRNENNIGMSENPLIIGLSKSYFEKLSNEDISFLEKYISQQIGLIAKIDKVDESAVLIEKIGSGKIDTALLTLNEYFIARQDYKVNPILQVVRVKDEKKYYAGIAVLVKNKGIKSFEDLNGKKIGARSPYSMSGFILPSLFFLNAKLKPEFVFTGSNEKSIKRLYKGELDAISVYRKMIDSNKNLKLIQPMGPIPNEPWICRKDLKKEYCDRIKAAIKSLSELKEGKTILSKMADISYFDEVDHQDYKETYDIIYNMGKDIYSLVPDGINLKKINEPYYFD